MSTKTFIALAGAIMVVVGLFLGLSSSSVTSSGGKEYTCGSAFSPDLADVAYSDSTNELLAAMGGSKNKAALVDQCSNQQGSKPTIAWLLIGFGALLAVGGTVTQMGKSPTVA